MSSEAFRTCLAFTMGEEGGFVDHPQDAGGQTKYGISKLAYPSEDIPNLTRERAMFLYERDYWAKVRGDDLPLPVALAVFDAAVTTHPLTASRWIQSAAGVTSDGIIGPTTLRAIRARPPAQLVNDLMHMRLAYLRTRPTWPTFGDGWQKRCLRVAFEAGRMVGVARPG